MIDFEQQLKNRIEFLKSFEESKSISESEWKYIENFCLNLNNELNCFEKFLFVLNHTELTINGNGENFIILCYLKNNYCLDFAIYENDKIEFMFYKEDENGITTGDYVEGFTNSENLILTIKEFLNAKF
jgi:hypothetical protein